MRYDPWGRPTIEPADDDAPLLSRIAADTNGDLLFVFTEPVLPPPIMPATAAIATVLERIEDAFELTANGVPVDGIARLDETYAGFERGSVVRFTPDQPLLFGDDLDVALVAGGLLDDWSNGSTQAFVQTTFGAGVLYTGPPQGTTSTDPIERSQAGNALLFQSHLYDYDVDLIHMRARVFDPHTGSFLQRDPEGYADSVNLYAGLAHNTINNTDPTGAKLRKIGKGVDTPKIKKAKPNKAKRKIAKAKPQRAKSNKTKALAGGQKQSRRSKGFVDKRPADSPHYSVMFEAKLKRGVDYPGRTDKAHFAASNKQLHKAFEEDAEFAKNLEHEFPGIVDAVRPGKRGGFLRNHPAGGLTWHHHPTRPGAMQLVPRSHHTAPGEVQKSLHPDQRGGMENWGGGRKKRRK